MVQSIQPPSANTAASASQAASVPNAAQNKQTPPLNLQAGQLINIQVTKTLATPTGSQIQFTLGSSNQTLIASSPNTLPENTKLQVLVKQTTPQLVLQLPPQNGPKTQEQLIQSTLRQLLPTQQSLPSIIAALSSDLKSLSPALQGMIAQTLERLIKPSVNLESLNGKRLKETIQNSGLFFENKLANAQTKTNAPLIQQDLKGSLFQILSLAQQSGKSSTVEKTQNWIDKITLQQIQALQQNFLNIEIPLYPNALIKQITIEVRSQLQTRNQWEIFIELDLSLKQEQGIISAKLLYDKDQDALSIFLWTKNTRLADKIAQQLDSLKTQLEADFLPIKQLTLSQSPLKSNPSMQKLSLIDIKI